MKLDAELIGPGEWGVDHIDRNGNRWTVCECGHRSDLDALDCARRTIGEMGRTVYETHRRIVGGGPEWGSLDADARAPWEHAAFAVRRGVVLG